MSKSERILYITQSDQRTEPMQHNYMQKIARLKITAGVQSLDVQHDSWCAVYTGGYCDCDPFIVDKRTGKRLA